MSFFNEVNMKNKSLIVILSIVAVLFIPALIKCHGIKPQSESLISSNVSDISKNIELVTAGGGSQPFYDYTYTTEAIDNKNFIFMKGFWASITVYEDDRIIYTGNDESPNNDMSVCWFNVPYSTDGHSLYIHTVPKKAHSGDSIITEIIFADKGDFNEYIFMDNLYAFIFFIFALMTGLLCLAGALSVRGRVSKFSCLTFKYLGIFILIAGTWLLLDSKLLLLVTNRTALISLVSFTLFMLMPAPLLMYISEMTAGSRRPYYIICGIILANTALYLVSYVIFPVMIPYTLTNNHILIMFTIFYVLHRCIRSARSYNTPEFKSILAGFIFVCIFSFMALIFFYVSCTSNYSYVYAIGIGIFIICMIIASLQRMYGYITDNANVSAYKQLAYVDSLTGLMNKSSFMLEHAKPMPSHSAAYIMFDLNGLKNANDNYGHKEGDNLIASAAECIRDVFGRIGKCYRFGGDELVVILYGFKSSEICSLLNHKLRDVLHAVNSKREIPVELSYGYAVCSDKSMTRQELFEKADERMYAMKMFVEGSVR